MKDKILMRETDQNTLITEFGEDKIVERFEDVDYYAPVFKDGPNINIIGAYKRHGTVVYARPFNMPEWFSIPFGINSENQYELAVYIPFFGTKYFKTFMKFMKEVHGHENNS